MANCVCLFYLAVSDIDFFAFSSILLNWITFCFSTLFFSYQNVFLSFSPSKMYPYINFYIVETTYLRNTFFYSSWFYDGATLWICVVSPPSPGGIGVPWSRGCISSRHDAVFAWPNWQEVTLHLWWTQNKEAEKWGSWRRPTHCRVPRVRDPRWSKGLWVKGVPPTEGGLHWQHLEPDQQDQHRWETAR